MERKTIKTISDTLSGWVERSEFHSPAEWLDSALELSVLLPDLMNEKTKYECLFEQKIIDLIDNSEKKISRSEAESRAKIDEEKVAGDMNAYKMYRYLDNREKSVLALIQVAKKYSEVRL